MIWQEARDKPIESLYREAAKTLRAMAKPAGINGRYHTPEAAFEVWFYEA
jgi:hypothetical protein